MKCLNLKQMRGLCGPAAMAGKRDAEVSSSARVALSLGCEAQLRPMPTGDVQEEVQHAADECPATLMVAACKVVAILNCVRLARNRRNRVIGTVWQLSPD
jgi:hypothetical protein